MITYYYQYKQPRNRVEKTLFTCSTSEVQISMLLRTKDPA
jgi:hypothetical protein